MTILCHVSSMARLLQLDMTKQATKSVGSHNSSFQNMGRSKRSTCLFVTLTAGYNELSYLKKTSSNTGTGVRKFSKRVSYRDIITFYSSNKFLLATLICITMAIYHRIQVCPDHVSHATGFVWRHFPRTTHSSLYPSQKTSNARTVVQHLRASYHQDVLMSCLLRHILVLDSSS